CAREGRGRYGPPLRDPVPRALPSARIPPRAAQPSRAAEALHRELHLAVGQVDLGLEGVDRDLTAGLDEPALHFDGVRVRDAADQRAVFGGFDPELPLVDLAVRPLEGHEAGRGRTVRPAQDHAAARADHGLPAAPQDLEALLGRGIDVGADEALGHALGEVGEGLRHRPADAHRHLGRIGGGAAVHLGEVHLDDRVAGADGAALVAQHAYGQAADHLRLQLLQVLLDDFAHVAQERALELLDPLPVLEVEEDLVFVPDEGLAIRGLVRALAHDRLDRLRHQEGVDHDLLRPLPGVEAAV